MKCCFCGKEINGYGNDPWPLNKNLKAECCDECNFTRVIPARLAKINERKEDDDRK